MAFSRQPSPVFSPAYRTVREALIRARRRAGVPQRELAARIGKCPSHISMIERGQRRVELLEFFVIATSLGADPVQLFRAATAGLADPAPEEPEARAAPLGR